tara:strand:+ start:1384 stop:1557 length:174 start_codon:yes stop_codon:yes gene_type:complete
MKQGWGHRPFFSHDTKTQAGLSLDITARGLLGFRNFDPLSGLTSKGDIALILAFAGL